MNKISCNVVKDLLPLYIDCAVSDATYEEVAAHLNDCETCRKEYELLIKDVPIPENTDMRMESAQVLKNMKRKLRRKRICVSVISVVLTLAISLFAWWGLTQYSCIPLKQEEITAVAFQFQDGSICITTTTPVTGFTSNITYDAEEKALYQVLTREILPRKASEIYSEEDILSGHYSGGCVTINPTDPQTARFFTESETALIEAYYIGVPGSKDVRLMWEKGMELPSAPKWAEENHLNKNIH